MDSSSTHRGTDKDLFAALPGGKALIEWFGFCPSFHDATLDRVELARGDAILEIKAFRATSEIDARGYYVLDRHALVMFRMRGVTGLKLDGDAGSIISEVTIRRLLETPVPTEWHTCHGPIKGDIEIAFATSIGLYGFIYAKELEFELQPLTDLSIA
jgi:hypothetical protein